MIANECVIFNALRAAGFTDCAAAGVTANLYAESGLKPDNVQNSCEKRFGNDSDYTARVNSGAYSRNSFMRDACGYGLAQWTFSTHKAALYDYCRKHSGNIANIDDQINFLVMECKTRGLFAKLNGCKTPYDAAIMFMLEFERPKNQTVTAQKSRGELGVRFYNDNVSSRSIDTTAAKLDDLYAVVRDTLNGKYGNGDARKRALCDKYDVVQTIINYIS